MTARARRLGAVLLAALVAFAAAGGAAGPARAAEKKAAKQPRLKKNEAWVTPDWEARGIRTIAIAPLRSTERNPEAETLVRRLLESALHERKYRFLGAGSILETVKRGAVEAEYAAAGQSFAREAPLDSASAVALREKLQTDAFLFVNITNWQRYLVDAQTRGASFTQVSVDAVLYSLADGAPVWRGSFQEKGDGPYNEPRASLGNSDRDPGGNTVGRASALEPPTFEEVVDKLAARLAAALPRPVPAAAPPAGGGL